MKPTIWKFLLTLGTQRVRMPAGAQLLDVQLQEGEPWLWARVDAHASPVQRTIAVCGTGHPAPAGPYIATFQHGPFVWHAFDGGEGSA